MMHKIICVAGTFDGLHRGHETLLRAAFAHGEHVVIALTSDAFVRQYKRRKEYDPRTFKPEQMIRSFAARKKDLLDWLTQKNFFDRAEIISLDDPVGPAATADYDALIVTAQNRVTGERINARRVQNGKLPMVLIDVPLVAAEDARAISSTRVRRNEIDRSGRLVMPDSMRDDLALPLGILVQQAQNGGIIISVGDMTTKMLLDANIAISLIIIDNMVNRKAFADLAPILTRLHSPTRKVHSGPGYIAKEAVAVINAWARDPRKQIVLEITGEEDLLTLPAIAYAPIGSVLYYGQPKKGVVEVVVTPEKKEQVRELLKKFIS